MRKVHLISVTEPLLFDLALAIHQKGYEVSVSGVGLTDTTLARLEKRVYLSWRQVVPGEIN